jgi:hypothetical protein
MIPARHPIFCCLTSHRWDACPGQTLCATASRETSSARAAASAARSAPASAQLHMRGGTMAVHSAPRSRQAIPARERSNPDCWVRWTGVITRRVRDRRMKAFDRRLSERHAAAGSCCDTRSGHRWLLSQVYGLLPIRAMVVAFERGECWAVGALGALSRFCPRSQVAGCPLHKQLHNGRVPSERRAALGRVGSSLHGLFRIFPSDEYATAPRPPLAAATAPRRTWPESTGVLAYEDG